MLNLCISATSSNQGKTILTSALLYHFRNRVRAYKIGPDFIDPQFHKFVSGDWSVNLDLFMQNKKQVEWTFRTYQKEINILEGVMGYYDGMDRDASAYDVTKLLNIPTLLVIDGSGSYITISAVLKGLKEYRDDSTIKAVVLNRLSSKNHYELIKKQIESDFDDVVVLGWIKKDLESLKDTHLGLDLENLGKIEKISQEVLENLELDRFEEIFKSEKKELSEYPFEKIDKKDETLAIVLDKNFSFLYYDNLCYLKEIFSKVIMIDSVKDEEIPKEVDIVYICGGYVESDKAYNRIKKSKKFKNSLICHVKSSKKVFGECAGLLYLGQSVDEKQMSGILPLKFSLQKRFVRLGYYESEGGVKGHCFHYTKPKSLEGWEDRLLKNGKGEFGTFRRGKVLGTYLHSFFRGRNFP